MLKRLFGRSKQSLPTPPSLPVQPQWNEPHHRFQDYFNLHLHGLSMHRAIAELMEKYLSSPSSNPVMLASPQGEWITVYCAPAHVARFGFNKLAADIARQCNIWLIGYRIYQNEGIDVHYFHGAEHAAGLAMGQGELEREPVSPKIFASLTDVSGIVPRPESQHPLDFHFALLAALGITMADLTWHEALQKYETEELPGARLLPAPLVEV
ncbi:MAG: hypothetical protein ACK47M_03540 [Caldilinea sp.]